MRAASNAVIALAVLALAFAIRIHDPLAPGQSSIVLWVCLVLTAAATFMGLLLDRKRRVAQFAGGLLGVFGLLGLLTASASDAIHSIGASVAGAGVALLLASLFLDLHPDPAQARSGEGQERPTARRGVNTHSRTDRPSKERQRPRQRPVQQGVPRKRPTPPRRGEGEEPRRRPQHVRQGAMERDRGGHEPQRPRHAHNLREEQYSQHHSPQRRSRDTPARG